MFKSIFAPRAKNTSIATITAKELQQQLADGENLVVIDVRTGEEYARDGRIAGARLLPLSALPVRLQELPTDQPIVCVCRSGARSQAACDFLVNNGFTNVFNLQGGMIAWQREKLPTL